MPPDRSNAEVARVFESIARLMSRQGENPFKIRAYVHAAQQLLAMSEPIWEIARRGELREIPGFGDAISSKTEEILATGTCALYERLKAEAAHRDQEAAEGESPRA